jgi:hypothetical protein
VRLSHLDARSPITISVDGEEGVTRVLMPMRV